MEFFGINITSKKKFDKLNGDIAKAYDDKKFGNLRAQLDYIKNLGGEEVRIPYYPLHERTLFDIAVYSDILRTIHMQLKKEIFRHGAIIEEKFAKKCEQCEKEFENPVDECDDCKKNKLPSNKLRDPDTTQKIRLEKFLNKCNDNDQTVLDVSSQINDDLETIDDGYMQLIKDYYTDEEGNIKKVVPVELLRIHPMRVRLIADKTGRPGRDNEGKKVLVCLNHRDNYYQDTEQCPQCGKKLYLAYFRTEGYGEEQQYTYYIKGEIYHRSKYMRSLTYGFPPTLSVWLKITTLMAQDRFMNNYYTKQRPPRGMFIINTPNMAAFEKAWNWMLDRFKKNPHDITPLAIENKEGAKGKTAEFIDFMNTMQEMQFIETRNEFRRSIGAVYGVMPLFIADTSVSGGLNNEGLQITVTNRAVEDGQGVFNDGFYPWLLEELGVTDYTYKLEPSEEKDEMAEEQLKMQQIQNAKEMQGMGYEITLNEDEEFEFGPTETPVQPQSQMGGFGEGFGGGFGGQQTGKVPGAKPPASTAPGQGQSSATSPQRFEGEPESPEKEKSGESPTPSIIQLGYGVYKIK